MEQIIARAQSSTTWDRQGGLSSPFLFNLFHKDLTELPNSKKCGVIIEGASYNVSAILLCSTVPTGLQELINCASKYIVQHCLRFNPEKSTCMEYGSHHFTQKPKWYINSSSLKEVNARIIQGRRGPPC